MSEPLREAAQRLVDVIFAEAQAEPFVLPLRGMRAANDLRAALAATPSEGPLDVEDEEHCCNDPSHMSPEYLARLTEDAG